MFGQVRPGQHPSFQQNQIIPPIYVVEMSKKTAKDNTGRYKITSKLLWTPAQHCSFFFISRLSLWQLSSCPPRSLCYTQISLLVLATQMETLSDDGGQLYESASPDTHPEPTAPPFPCSRAADHTLPQLLTSNFAYLVMMCKVTFKNLKKLNKRMNNLVLRKHFSTQAPGLTLELQQPKM